MPEFTAQRLAEWTGGTWTTPPAGPVGATGYCVDSRQLRAGQIFVAIKTARRDGHEWIAAAASAGASAAIVGAADRAVALPQLVVADPLTAFQAIAREHRRAFRGRVVGVSGSAGKTSTKDLLALLLGGSKLGVTAAEDLSGPAAASAPSAFTGRVLATEANLNNHLGVPLTLTRLDPAAHDFAIVEAGISAPGEMAPLAAMIAPDVALITLIAAAHTQELGGIEGVAREKAVLPAAVRPGGMAVYPRDAAQFQSFRDLDVPHLMVERSDSLRPAHAAKHTVYFTLAQQKEHTEVTLAQGAEGPLTFTLRRVSDGMAQNAVLAITAARWLGVSADLIQSRLAAWQAAPLRGEVRHDHGRLIYADCYNANPASMADALAAFAAIAPAAEPRLFVIGCMEELGSSSETYHHALGHSLALRPEDQAILIGAQAEQIVAGALAAGMPARQLHIAPGADAVEETVRWWRGSVFVKGSRRHQLERVFVAEPDRAGAPSVASSH